MFGRKRKILRLVHIAMGTGKGTIFVGTGRERRSLWCSFEFVSWMLLVFETLWIWKWAPMVSSVNKLGLRLPKLFVLIKKLWRCYIAGPYINLLILNRTLIARKVRQINFSNLIQSISRKSNAILIYIKCIHFTFNFPYLISWFAFITIHAVIMVNFNSNLNVK